MKDNTAPVSPRPELSRRAFCRSALLACASLALPLPVLAKGLDAVAPERRLSFYNTHTGERLNQVPFSVNGRPLTDALQAINTLLRDHRSGEIAKIDIDLLDQLWLLNQQLDNDRPLHVISGYRSPHTNQMLRATGGGGVARRSLHMDGKAIDIRIPGLATRNLYRAALSLQQGGVGHYPSSRFVHLDTGRVRTWSGS
ncbi:MAG: DUF882 domain-containing protein [Desulfuromonadales bacterium]|nr:DUF882 domain-containing protein [Desulfuromonadales bacterium]